MTQTQAIPKANTDPKTVPIQDVQDFYVPAFKIIIAGQSAGPEIIHDILRVSYKDSLTEIDSFEITVNNWDEVKYTFRYSDGDKFLPGQRLELWMGYFGEKNMRKMLTGEITTLRPSFPAGGQQTLTVSGLNLLHRLRKKQESHSYVKKSDNKIACEIGQRLAVNIVTDPNGEGHNNGDKIGYILQYNEPDILFLLKRARAIGYDLFVDENPKPGVKSDCAIQPGRKGSGGISQLIYGPSQNVSAVSYEIEYGRTLIDFSPTLTTHNQVSSVTVIGWDTINKAPIKGTAERKNSDIKGVGKAGGQEKIDKAFDEKEEVIVNRPVHNKAEAEAMAKQILNDIAKEFVKGSGSVVGLPNLRAGSVIHLKGLGKRFSGRYFVTSTSHTIDDSGYITHFDCRREER
jgi:uncharacterized protein